ncbi:MAG: VOC family protein [Dehalococcoidia bacterium]
MAEQLAFTGLYLFVRDMEATLAFYRRLGLNVESVGGNFARAALPGGGSIEFGTAELTRSYDPGWREPNGPSTNTLNFSLASREAVDDVYDDLTAAGYRGHLAPIDAFWGSRYAIVDDPDGNIVGLHSPRDPDKSRPPDI